ncbi:pyridoxal phosphate-dependent aminotransferase [Endozoicomonadaceae bacterium StTr2]
MSQLNTAVSSLQPSVTLQINELSERLIGEGRDIIRLGFGQSPFPVPEIVVDALRQHAASKSYLPVKGLQPLRETVAAYYQQRDGIKRTADSVMIGPGSKMLLFQLQEVCKGELILPSPSWVSYEPQAHLLNKPVRYIPTSLDTGWRISPEQLDQLGPPEKDTTRLLILNYPSNPTGATYEPEQLKALAEAARRNQIIMVVDEIYDECRFDGEHHSLAKWYPEGTIISGGLSKWCGAGGWRLGVMIFPQELMLLQDKMAVIASETWSAVAAPIQYAAITAYQQPPEVKTYLGHCRQGLKAVAGYMQEHLTRSGVDVAPSSGGFYLFPGFDKYRESLAAKGIKTADQFCVKLMEDTGVALLPGTAFGFPEDRFYTRLAYVDFDGGALLKAIAQKSGQPLDSSLDNAFIEKHCPKIAEACRRIDGWLKAL